MPVSFPGPPRRALARDVESPSHVLMSLFGRQFRRGEISSAADSAVPDGLMWSFDEAAADSPRGPSGVISLPG
jgi:hypothetical protein